MTNEEVQQKVRQFVSQLLRQSSLTETIRNTLLFLTSFKCKSPTEPYDEYICDSCASAQIRLEFLLRHFSRRPIIRKIFSFVNSSSTSSVERNWRSVLLRIFAHLAQDAPVSISIEALFTLRRIVADGRCSEQEKMLAIDGIHSILIRQHFLSRLVMESNLAVEDVSDLSTLISGLPSAVANLTKGKPPVDFELSPYLCNMISSLMAGIESSECPNYKLVGRIFGRLCHSGHAVAIWRQVLPADGKHLKLKTAESIRHAILHVDAGHLSSCVFPIFLLAPNWRVLSELFIGESINKRPDLEALVRRALIGHFYVQGLGGPTDDGENGSRVIGALVKFAAQWSSDLILDIFKTLLFSWAAPHVIEGVNASHADHYYRCRALIAASVHIDGNHLAFDVRNVVLPAITRHLSSTVPETRLLGMVVGEILVEKLKLGLPDDDDNRLKFDYEETIESKALKSMLRNDEEMVLVNCFLKQGIDEINLQEVTKLHHVESQKKIELDSDDDDDEDFPAMDVSEDLPLSGARGPKYIRDCIEGLRSTKPEEMETLLASVEVGERLIRDHPSSAREVAEDFAQAVIHLAPDCPVPSLQQKRISMLVALTEAAPVTMANFLTQAFYQPNLSIPHRIDILAAIADSAQRLSDPDINHSQENSHSKWAELESRVTGRMRRKVTVGTPSRFSSIAGHFFFPLLAGFDCPTGILDLQRDHIVLGRLLLTLACVMSSAQNAAALPNMAVAMLDFVTALRGHTDASVRRGLLFACAAVAGVCPSHILLPRLSNEMTEIRDWLRASQVVDPDQNCRQLAVWTSSIVGARFRDFIQIT